MKQVINIISDNIYTILEFDDGTLLPLISVEEFLRNNIDRTRCIYCQRNNQKMVSFNNIHYICKSCAEKMIERFAEQGESISLNLSKFNPKIVENLKNFLTTGQVDKAVFKVVEKGDGHDGRQHDCKE